LTNNTWIRAQEVDDSSIEKKRRGEGNQGKMIKLGESKYTLVPEVLSGIIL